MKTNTKGSTTSANRNPICAWNTKVKYQAKNSTVAARGHSLRRKSNRRKRSA